MKKQDSRYYDGNRQELVSFLPDTYQYVLEIGCGDGSFRRNLIDKCEYWGIEPAEVGLSEVITKNCRVLKGYFHEVYDQLPDGYFDIVICNDVIEHIADHNTFLQKIKHKISKNGVIVGSIPNVRFYDNLLRLLRDKDWEYKESGILDYSHLRFFTEKSLKNTFLKNGYKIESFEGINDFSVKTKSIRKLVKYYYLKLVLSLLSINNSDIKFQQYGFKIKS